MRRIGIRELRDTLTATIRRVRAGETFEITHDGVPVALLAPLPRDRVARLIAAGDVQPPRHDRRPGRRYPTVTGVSASEALEEDRAGR
jgi:antitoxin (DNA-binding transcriptional repressor) of toxin-antitoxin stability system